MAGPSSLTIHTLCGMASRASRRRASPSSRGNVGGTEVLQLGRELEGYSGSWLGVSVARPSASAPLRLLGLRATSRAQRGRLVDPELRFRLIPSAERRGSEPASACVTACPPAVL